MMAAFVSAADSPDSGKRAASRQVGRELLIVILVGVALLPLARLLPSSAGNWPQRPIELVVFTGPGGGLDMACRILGAAMSEELDAEIRVSNMTGGRGGVAAQYVHGRQHDGYRWLGFSEALLSLAARGSHHTTAEDWHPFIFAGSPGIISVPSHSAIRSYAELMTAIREHPGRLTISASGRGSIWHLRTEMLRARANLDVRYIPYDGSGPSQVAALSGEVDLVHTALAEQIGLIRSGHLRPLVAVELEGIDPGDGTHIPPITAFVPELAAHLPLPQWLGFQLPKGTPAEVLAAIDTAFHAALVSPKVRAFVERNHYHVYGFSGVQARTMIQRSEKLVNWLLYDLGLVERSPADFGIARLHTSPDE
jgi:tripartite-type tricarboxylate transporter receptor subunit TctC